MRATMREARRAPDSPRASAKRPAPTPDRDRPQRSLGNRAVQRLLRAPADDLSAAHIHQAAALGLHSPAAAYPHRGRIEAALGGPALADVHAHLGPQATASASAMHADAFTSANHVVFAGDPDLHTAAHEAAHVLQQRSGADVPHTGRCGDVWERHADAFADAVVAGDAPPRMHSAHTGAATSPAVQRLTWSSVKKWGGRALGALGGVALGALAVAVSPLIGLVGGAYTGYKAASSAGAGAGLRVLAGIGGALAGAVLAPVAVALTPLVGGVLGGIEAARYAEGSGAGSQILHGIGGGLAGALLPFTAGAVVGASRMDRVTQDPADPATLQRVTGVAQGHGITLDAPSRGAGPWLEQELEGLEQALDVYDAILSNKPTARSLALGIQEGTRPWDLRGKHIRREPDFHGPLDPTNAYASPDNGVTVCGDSLLRQLGGSVFNAQVHKGILVHELGHALLKHELLPFQQDIDAYLLQHGGGRRNFWELTTVNGRVTQRSKRTGGDLEYPITAYGGVTPDEDLCETLRFYFQSATSRETLRARAPARYHAIERIVRENLQTVAVPDTRGPVAYSDERGARQTALLSQAHLQAIHLEIGQLRLQLPGAQTALDTLTRQRAELLNGRNAHQLSTPEKRTYQALRDSLSAASLELRRVETRLDTLERRAARLGPLLNADQRPANLPRSQYHPSPALSDYDDDKYRSAQFIHSLPA